MLQKLEPLLDKRKPKLCKGVMEEVNNFSWPDEHVQSISDLDRLIDKYKFKDAQPILKTTIEKLKSNLS